MSRFADIVRTFAVCSFLVLLGMAGCSKPTVDKSTATLMSFSNASQNISARVLPSVIRLDMTYQRQSTSDLMVEMFGEAPATSELGSGVIISKDGLALTNYHVVHGAQSVKVTLTDGRQVKAEIVGTDALTDLALIKLPLADLPAAEWGDSEKARAGALVWSFGSPLGMNGSVSLGVISSSLRKSYGDNPYQDFLQTDAYTNPGSSGGPLIDVTGKIVGINTAIRGDLFAGVGFATPSSIAKEVAKQLKEHGKMDRAWIGVELAAVSQDQAILAGRTNVMGATIRRFENPSTPGESDGLKVGDVLLEINAEKILGSTHAYRLIARTRVSEPLKILIQRQSETMTVTVQPKPRPNT